MVFVQNLYFIMIMELVGLNRLVETNIDLISVPFQVRQILSLCPNITHLNLTQTNVTDFAFDR